jgi:hypothetical protein
MGRLAKSVKIAKKGKRMKPEIAKQLQAILDNRDKQSHEAAVRVSEQEKTEAKNLIDFAAKKDEVIKPAFNEIIDIYRAKGLTLRITEEDERPRHKGGIEPPYVALDMAGAYSSRSSDMKPQFRLTLEKRNRKVSVFTSTQSMSGPAGDVPLDSLTSDWIHEAFLKYESGRQ